MFFCSLVGAPSQDVTVDTKAIDVVDGAGLTEVLGAVSARFGTPVQALAWRAATGAETRVATTRGADRAKGYARRAMSALCRGTVEARMCNGRWAEIEPDDLPRGAAKAHANALRNVYADGSTRVVAQSSLSSSHSASRPEKSALLCA